MSAWISQRPVAPACPVFVRYPDMRPRSGQSPDKLGGRRVQLELADRVEPGLVFIDERRDVDVALEIRRQVDDVPQRATDL